ncbi:L-aspartate oxidase [Bacillus sp. FJAT-42376]|uniref:L-aspartate oxidase n=1 Tax=Bacillus sp. FJAT-42376 TaxID=2014076 RepID=UPI000F4FFF2D|nr:L-aspartate oxidase [Bacillus sp. FJAT-42376]AZB43777.1 L-aspartate oxidase [Bacillus sp. FJAT-42376]
MRQTDVLIVGSGIAALAAAYHICEELNVTLVTKGRTGEGNSYMAQGGVAAALSEQDSWEKHFEDTVFAGDGHTQPEAVKQLTSEGSLLIQHLIKDGMPADRTEDGTLKLGREGAHRQNRIIHSGGDETGKALIQFLVKKVKNKVRILENTMVAELLVENGKCCGACILREDGNTEWIQAGAVVLAAGGCGALYKTTSNHSHCTGDGIALAYRAGARLTDMEFVQFHPTMLHKEGKVTGLISEAVRGEGAFLENAAGQRIMETAHPMKDLAPRDVVSREMFKRIQNGESIFLNIQDVPEFEKRFPSITKMCTDQGINLEQGLIPVMPGMHFFMGGIKTDLNGRTNIERLYAAGEAACTGVHGANRLASNSLLEGLVFGKKIAEDLNHADYTMRPPVMREITGWTYRLAKQDIADRMDRFAGIERDEDGLNKLAEWFIRKKKEIQPAVNLTAESLEIANMLTVGELIARAALQRTESRGCHFRADYPVKEVSWERKEIVWNHSKKALEVMA